MVDGMRHQEEMMATKNSRTQRISPELDELSCALMGEALDRLAEGADVHVLLAVGDAQGNACSWELADDGEEACLTGARDKVRALKRTKGDQELGLGSPKYYAICYEGAIADDQGEYLDALLMEFGEQGRPAFSAYSLFEGRGMGDGFGWTDPAPAGEVDALL